MLDRLYMGSEPEREVLYRPDYHPDDVVRAAEVINPDSPHLVALFPPWHGGGRAYDKLTGRIVDQGKAVLRLTYDDQILSPDPGQVLSSFQTATTQSAEHLHELADSGQYERISLFAASLGTPALAMTASLFDRFSHATMITPGDNLAACMWQGIRTRRLRRELENRGATYDSVNEAWLPISPVNHIAALAGKSLRIVISTTDEVIPAANQKAYVRSLRDLGLDPVVRSSRMGHYGTIGRFCWFGNLKHI